MAAMAPDNALAILSVCLFHMFCPCVCCSRNRSKVMTFIVWINPDMDSEVSPFILSTSRTNSRYCYCNHDQTNFSFEENQRPQTGRCDQQSGLDVSTMNGNLIYLLLVYFIEQLYLLYKSFVK